MSTQRLEGAGALVAPDGQAYPVHYTLVAQVESADTKSFTTTLQVYLARASCVTEQSMKATSTRAAKTDPAGRNRMVVHALQGRDLTAR